MADYVRAKTLGDLKAQLGSDTELNLKTLEMLDPQRTGKIDVKLLETQPFNFLNNNGFRLNFSLSNEGLKNKALAYGSIINKKLYLMIYIAPLVEFYDRYEDDFISMAENATL